ncbi:hypothetical protein HPP92_002474 [Vanilla planifolia]|uniref:RRM domain-containing protein n=1 Tax=Vanilla planifolia TaxID=51239 RepID=A0A835VI03_VANPL|nr:hypothetical protein HPP92_002474 [Vanilla planifolia]
MNRGFAFLEFSSRSDAMDAYRRLQKRDVVFGVDRSAKVAFADSFIEPDDEIMSQVKTVFIDGIPPAWDEERALDLVKKYGKIEKIELARNMPAAKRKDFGFVTFDTHEAAVACAEGINNSEVGDRDNKVKIRSRLSRPLQRGRGKRVARGDFRIGRIPSRDIHVPWSRTTARRFPVRASRGSIGRGALAGGRVPKRPVGFRERRPVPAIPARARPLPPPERSYERRPPILAYSRSNSRREYDRRDEIAPRGRAVTEYGSRIHAERRQPYGVDFSRGGGYPEITPRTLSRSAERRTYTDEGYGRKLERPLPPYREGRNREYDSLSGSKRPYSALDDVHTRYADVGARNSRARLDYGGGGSGTAHYEDNYGERLGRSHMGYSGSRSSLSGHDSHGLYGGRQGISYGSVSESDGGMYSSGYNNSYLSRSADVPRRSDVGGSSYSSMYSGRNLSDTSYLRGSGSGSYY